MGYVQKRLGLEARGGHGKSLINEADLEPEVGQILAVKEHKTKFSLVERVAGERDHSKI